MEVMQTGEIDRSVEPVIRSLATQLPYLPPDMPDGSYSDDLKYEFGNGFQGVFPVISDLARSSWCWDQVAESMRSIYHFRAVQYLRPHAPAVMQFAHQSEALPRIIGLLDRESAYQRLESLYCDPDGDRAQNNATLQNANPDSLGWRAYHAAFLNVFNPLLRLGLDEMIAVGLPTETLQRLGKFNPEWLAERVTQVTQQTPARRDPQL